MAYILNDNVKNNIQVVIDNALCTACGACAGICNKNAVSMITNIAGYLTAKINYYKCISCGICNEVCPSIDVNTPLMKDIDIFHGVYINGYVGHAVDDKIRQKSQSGGIATALLCYLLENNLIEGAVVNKFNITTRRPEAVFETTRDGIISAAGSYYSQSSVVKTILENRDKKMAAVTLGCQSESLNLIRDKYPKIRLPAYTIGLICAGQYSGKYIDDLIAQSGCGDSAVTGFRFRDKDAGGWPGNVKIHAADNEYILDKKYRHMLKSVYEAYRCLLCFNQMNINSDITVGDPWGIIDKVDKKGNSVVITRTIKGQELIEDAMTAGAINVESLPVEKIFKGQTVDCRLKTQFFTAMKIVKSNGYIIPYKLDRFENIYYKKPDIRQSEEINKRLNYSRKIFLEKDIYKLKRSIKIRKNEAIIKKTLTIVLIISKRFAKYLIRKLKRRKYMIEH